jgi:hypothetical protein
LAISDGVDERSRNSGTAAPFHPLRDSFLQPSGRTLMRFLSHETVRQFVL